MNVHWQIGLLWGATFKIGKEMRVSLGRRSCQYRQHSKEEGHECSLAHRALLGDNVQKRGGHVGGHGREELPLWATFIGRTCMSIGRRGCR
jgi:hypothetical protein